MPYIFSNLLLICQLISWSITKNGSMVSFTYLDLVNRSILYLCCPFDLELQTLITHPMNHAVNINIDLPPSTLRTYTSPTCACMPPQLHMASLSISISTKTFVSTTLGHWQSTHNWSFFSIGSLTLPVSLSLSVNQHVCTLLLIFRWNTQPISTLSNLPYAHPHQIGVLCICTLLALPVDILTSKHLDDTMSSTFNCFHQRQLHFSCTLYL